MSKSFPLLFFFPCFPFVFFANTFSQSSNTRRPCSFHSVPRQLASFLECRKRCANVHAKHIENNLCDFFYNFRPNGKLSKTVYLSNAIFNWQLKADEKTYKQKGTGQQPHFEQELYIATQTSAYCLIKRSLLLGQMLSSQCSYVTVHDSSII